MDKNNFDKIFTPEIKTKADALVAKYETKRAAILMILRLVQDHYGYISHEAEAAVAHYLGLPPIDVHEVVTFYTLFYSEPRAKTQIHVCRTLACSLLGADKITRYLEEKLGVKPGEITADGQFSFDQVECLGACEIAPMLQVNEGQYIGCVTTKKIDVLLDDVKNGKLETLKKQKITVG
ncbi:MAG TPA: NAD(P)H-dependent oxidoreductase subunit E [Verrucomicrobiae bacterium]|jgi:NADH-quinone oxidoreductase subunit E|nr:NAD(P)H-dependent oxidoreductase subunit E [Verrucomicrobiae bacterium]